MTKNVSLNDWITEIQTLCTPDNVVIWNGTQKEYKDLAEDCVNNGPHFTSGLSYIRYN